MSHVKRIFTVVLGLALLYVLALAGRVYSSESFVKSRNIFSSADVAIVFFGDPSSNVLRLNKAIESYNRGLVGGLGFVGGCRPAQHYFGSHELAIEARRRGVPAEHIFVGQGSYDSLSNIKSVSELLAGNEWQSLSFVSDPLHLQRIIKVAMSSDMQGGHDDRIIQANVLETGYGEGYISAYKRANYEIIVSVLHVVLSESAFDSLVRKLRLGQLGETDYAQCVITPVAP